MLTAAARPELDGLDERDLKGCVIGVVGILGTGRIASAIVTGLCDSTKPPDLVLVSPRNAEIAQALAEQHPSVSVANDNDEIVRTCDVIVVALPPGRTEEALEALDFRAEQRVVSVVAMVCAARIQRLVSPARSVRALTLPSISHAMGPIVVYPASGWATDLLGPLGDVFAVEAEAHLDAIWGSTSVIAAQLEQIVVVTRVLETAGVPLGQADSYARSMLAAVYAHAASSPSSLPSLLEEAQTPGGLNQQVLAQLRQAGTFAALENALDAVSRRVRAGQP